MFGVRAFCSRERAYKMQAHQTLFYRAVTCCIDTIFYVKGYLFARSVCGFASKDFVWYANVRILNIISWGNDLVNRYVKSYLKNAVSKRDLVFPLVFLSLSLCGLKGQYSIVATPIETWVNPQLPSSDYNLNNAYLYLLNGQAMQSVFEGEGLPPREKKEVGLRKGDYPQYMYLAISIKDPVQENNSLTIPLMINDMRNPNTSTRVMEYGGRFLENIPDEILKNGDIVAKVKFEAIKTNTGAEFWKKTSEISVQLGKTATSLLNPALLAGPFVNLAQQIIPQIDKGLRSLEQVEDPQKMVSEFYIKLISKELSALYQERVVSATLYRMHWDIDAPPKSRYFANAQPKQVDDLRKMVTNTAYPYFLVVNTKAEYNTDHSELVYNQSYIDRKAKDFRKIQNPEKREAERAFLDAIKQAVELRRQIDAFQNSLNTRYADWLAYSRAIDLYYAIWKLKNQEAASLTKLDATTRDKYLRLYSNVMNDINLWFSGDLLVKARNITTYLIQNPGSVIQGKGDARKLYEDISLLDFFRDRVKQTEIQGKLPKEIEGLEAFTLATRKLEDLESALFDLEFQPSETLKVEEKKEWLRNRVSRTYPLCQACARMVSEKIAAIENASYEQNLRRFRQLSSDYYNELECHDEVVQRLEYYIKVQTDSMTVSTLVLESLKKDREELLRLSNVYSSIFSRDAANIPQSELAELIQRAQLTREKFLLILQRLRGRVIPEEEVPCLLKP